ncbi:VOC family protein [Paenibacillus sp. VCA1]|uniref:VOC family protein n=1 Tax=Paenibacillus sp. VCA1 TaxID=3039148 RepID=UPI002871D539|nr:VOC family protein [Paenibacillus sp. VCA1]MDR9854252.1 VOC family protein [Paenibacillus sp. VCA1]
MPPGMTTIRHIDRVLLPVPDVRLAAEWYASEIEFQIARRGSKEIDLKIHDGETWLTLTEPEEREPFRPQLHLDAEGHVPCFNLYTHWVDLHGEWLKSRGIRITDTMRTPYMNVCEMADPFGNVVGICHEKEHSLFYTPSPRPLPPMFHRILAVFLPVKDLEASIRWYSDVLGFQLHNHWGQGADLKIGEGETIVTMICMDEGKHRQALQAMNGRAIYSLQSSDIREAYRQLCGKGVAAGLCRDQDGIQLFYVTSPEGLTIRISEKEMISVG